MKVSDNFVIQEFVPPEIYSIYGSKSIWFIDPDMIAVAQKLRDDLGKPITINNWHTGGQYKNSGFRMPDTLVGGKLSQHKFGRALDIKVKGMSAESVREYIRENYYLYDEVITTIEKDTPTWVHIDKRWTGLNGLLEVPYL